MALTPQEHEREKALEESQVIQERPFPKTMTPEIRDAWGDGIPAFSEADPLRPEWRKTPEIEANLYSEGYGTVHIKNEADRLSNPTGTIKDRAVWELATLYRDFARTLYMKWRSGRLTIDELKQIQIPRLSLITSGNEGVAIAERFYKHFLPPPKLIMDKNVSPAILERLKRLYADLYLVDLSKKLTTEDILRLSNNPHGTDITSTRIFKPQATFYDWHVHEAFNFEPDTIIVPYGSGRLAENYLYWQGETVVNDSHQRRDPRLTTSVGKVTSINILAGEPISPTSSADKLTAAFKPFLLFKDEDFSALAQFNFTGKHTAKIGVEEHYIKYAHEIMKGLGIPAEPSGATALALYLQQYDQGLISKREKVLVVNTGEGLTEETVARESVKKILTP